LAGTLDTKSDILQHLCEVGGRLEMAQLMLDTAIEECEAAKLRLMNLIKIDEVTRPTEPDATDRIYGEEQED
jgi:hypothetical protein